MGYLYEIQRIKTSRNKIRDKLVEAELIGADAKIDALAEALSDVAVIQGEAVQIQNGEIYVIPKGYHNGFGTVAAVTGDENYFLQSKEVQATENEQFITPDSGYYGLSSVKVAALPTYADGSMINPDDVKYAVPPYNAEYARQFVSVARSYWDARIQGMITFFYDSGNGVFEGKLSDADGNGIIDCSTFVLLSLLGISFQDSPYANISGPYQSWDASAIVARNDKYSWANPELIAQDSDYFQDTNGRVRYAADLAHYMWASGRCFTDINEVKPGDLVFHAGVNSDGSYQIKNRFKHISHVGIVAEEGWEDRDPITYYNVTNVTNVIVRTKYSARTDVVFFARPDLEKKYEYPEFDSAVNRISSWVDKTGTYNGSVATINGNELIFTGQPTSSVTFRIISSSYPLFLEAGTYEVSGCPSREDVSSGYTWGFVVKDPNGNDLVWDLGNGGQFTLTELTGVYAYIYISSSKVPDGYTWAPAIRRVG